MGEEGARKRFHEFEGITTFLCIRGGCEKFNHHETFHPPPLVVIVDNSKSHVVSVYMYVAKYVIVGIQMYRYQTTKCGSPTCQLFIN